MLRGLLVEAAHIAVRYDAGWRRHYVRLAMKKNRSIAAVAIARKLAVRLWWMWKLGLDVRADGGVRFACRVARVPQWGERHPREPE